jgi:hypothetical protein
MNHPGINYQNTPLQMLQISLWVLLVFFAFSANVFAQQDSTITGVHKIYLKDGSVLVGYSQSENDSLLTFKTLTSMELLIPRDQILKRETTSGTLVRGEFWRRDPNRTRMLFAPTARPLKTGQGYFSIYEIFFPFVAVGLTDFLSIAGGMTLVPGAENQLFYIAPKITPVHLENFDVAAGVLYILIPTDSENAGIVYGVSTYGTEKASLTVGLGWGFLGDDFSDKPILVLGGDVRLSGKTKLITENWILPDSDVSLVSLGIRFFGENLAADFGLVYPAGEDPEGFPFLPWVGFAYNFGPEK